MSTDSKKSTETVQTFLSNFSNLITNTTEQSIKLAQDEDEKAVIKAFAPTLIEEVNQLNSFILQYFKKSSLQQKAEIDQVIQISSGISLTENAKSIFPSLGSIIGKLGLSRIVKEIKKIIRMILDALGINLPKWLDAVLNLIDEILDAIFGAGSSKLATILSIQEQNYLSELTHLAKLQQANQFKYQDDHDDE